MEVFHVTRVEQAVRIKMGEEKALASLIKKAGSAETFANPNSHRGGAERRSRRKFTTNFALFVRSGGETLGLRSGAVRRSGEEKNPNTHDLNERLVGGLGEGGRWVDESDRSPGD